MSGDRRHTAGRHGWIARHQPIFVHATSNDPFSIGDEVVKYWRRAMRSADLARAAELSIRVQQFQHMLRSSEVVELSRMLTYQDVMGRLASLHSSTVNADALAHLAMSAEAGVPLSASHMDQMKHYARLDIRRRVEDVATLHHRKVAQTTLRPASAVVRQLPSGVTGSRIQHEKDSIHHSRQALQSYSEFRSAADRNDVESLALSWLRIRALHPDILSPEEQRDGDEAVRAWGKRRRDARTTHRLGSST